MVLCVIRTLILIWYNVTEDLSPPFSLPWYLMYGAGPPRVTSAPTQYGSEGEIIKVECLVQSVPLPSRVSWSRNMQVGVTAASSQQTFHQILISSDGDRHPLILHLLSLSSSPPPLFPPHPRLTCHQLNDSWERKRGKARVSSPVWRRFLTSFLCSVQYWLYIVCIYKPMLYLWSYLTMIFFLLSWCCCCISRT